MKRAKIAHALEMMGLEGMFERKQLEIVVKYLQLFSLKHMSKPPTENLNANIMEVLKRLAKKKQEETDVLRRTT